MNYPISSTYKGWTILEYSPANAGNRFRIVYPGGNESGLFESLKQAQDSIDYLLEQLKGDGRF
ncbi:hypothetical protein [Pseudomonas prosekii]|uniref:Uncharacterized protein n=1 Tax=Pseudomonas prosekii TaxID=1148509 RepID=A0A1H1ZKG5_9PSED|nr:hypothetical protein [Pseudomonas prosekii]SDT34164.1 hypothetical protein SAMN05216222_3966 [Pseudomonas prosekii]